MVYNFEIPGKGMGAVAVAIDTIILYYHNNIIITIFFASVCVALLCDNRNEWD